MLETVPFTKGRRVSLDWEDLSLEECILELEKRTDLKFKILDTRYIAIGEKSSRGIVSGVIRDQLSKEVIEGAFIHTGKSYASSGKFGYKKSHHHRWTESAQSVPGASSCY